MKITDIAEDRPKTARDRIKFVAGIVVTSSVSKVIVSLAHQNVTTATNVQTAQLYIGAYVLGSMVASSASEYVDGKIDRLADAIAKLKKDADAIDQIKQNPPTS